MKTTEKQYRCLNIWEFFEWEKTTFCLPACTAEDQKHLATLMHVEKISANYFPKVTGELL